MKGRGKAGPCRYLATGLGIMVSLGAARMLRAQLNTGIVEGFVTDPAGAAVANAEVTVTSLDTGVANPTRTNSTGYYRAVDLVPGRYRVHIEASGFSPVDLVGIEVPAGQTVKEDGQLKVGSTRQLVEVTAAASLVETAPSNTSSAVDSQIIQDMPLQGRDLQQLIFLLPGVQNDAGPPGSNFGFNSQFGIFPDPTYVQGSDVSVNGGQGGANAWYLDGSLNVSTLSENINVNPSPDAVSEFQAITSNLAAEYGRTGGGVFNVVLKSGTNKLHGSLYDYIRNSALDARNPFTSVDANGNLIPSRRLQFTDAGGTIGGPVILPHIYNGRDKTFFFFSLDKTILHLTGTAAPFTVPTPLMRSGDFSEDPNASSFGIWNPLSTTGPDSSGQFQRTAFGAPAAGYSNGCLNTVVEAGAKNGVRTCNFSTQIPSSMLNPVAQFFVNSYPLPNFNDPNSNCPMGKSGYKICDNYLAMIGNSQDPLNMSIKVDHSYSDKSKFLVEWLFNPGSYNIFRTPWTGPTFPSVGFGASFPVDFANQVATVGHTYVFSPTLVNEFRASFSRQYMNSHPSTGTFPESVTDLSAVQQELASSQIFLGPGVPDPEWELNMVEGRSSTFGNPGFLNMMRAGEAYTILDNVTKTLGRHTLMTGFLYRDEHDGRLIYDPTQVNFDGTLVQDPITGLGGFGLEQFILGAPSPSVGGLGKTQTGLTGQPYQVDHYWGFFGQDDFRVKPNFTLNVGLRWDIPGYWRTRQQPMSNFCLNCTDSATGMQGEMIYSGSPQLPAGANIFPANKKDFAPRFNFSWSPRGNNKTVIRAGYDMFYTNATNALNNDGQGVAPGPLWQTFSYWEGSANPSTCAPFLGECLPWELGSPTVPTGQLTQPPIPANGLSPAQEKVPGYGYALQFYAPPPAVDPMVQMWNVDVQRELPGDMMVEIGYVGSHGTHLAGDTFRNYNYVPTADKLKYQSQLNSEVPISNYFSGNTLALMEQTWGGTKLPLSSMLVPYPLFSSIFSQTVLDATSSYNAVHFKVQKRFSHGLNFISIYTISKEIDSCTEAQLASQLFDPIHSGYAGNIGGRIGAQGGGFASGASGVFGTGCQNEDNRAADRTISIADIPQDFNFAGTYELPVGSGRHFLNHGGLAGALLGGWILTGNFNAESGTPLEVSGPCDAITCRPDLVGDPSLSHSRPKADLINDWINPNAFLPPYGADQTFWQNPTATDPRYWQFGTAGLYLPGLRGPGFWNVDTSLSKQFRFGEGRYVQFRWEVYNTLNHQNLGLPNTNFCLAPGPGGATDAVHQAGCSFGKITNIQTDPRAMEFSLKFAF
ncbi:MAG TPA: carboxypeptidase regulatory-like domain-containing protein [Terriglobia bacterium]|nr:carboxypeptidase regulatory-like domain-containing protein [Terriglobia bacterium]